ncbi:unnamed protein product [Echinostoma caproni]|uniref:Heterogeneous nuclear ribonucleoprotein L like n=1 Tax=Echinostoma caproni TaxID=27848 RepID=A0A183AU60_9TREM|nr:unnamed protein product [Echinostoma caproni]
MDCSFSSYNHGHYTRRPRQISEEVVEPSPVIHIRGLPEHTLEIDLLKIFEQNGSVRDVAMMPQKRQALVEFLDIDVARRVVERGSSDEAGESSENHVLLYTVYNAQYPITIDLIHQISSPFGKILRIVIFRKSQVQAMVEFRSVNEARLAKRNLSGADIYTGCCTLKVDYARPVKLTVTKNDKDSWDFEMATQHNLLRSIALQGRYDGNPCFQPDSNYVDNPSLYPQAQLLQNRSLMYSPQAFNGTGQPARSNTSVAMIYNLNMEHVNCDRLFNVVCLYGNVIRIKFLRSNEGAAMVQMGEPVAVDDLIDNLSGAVVLEVSQPYSLPDGSPSFKDFSRCRNNRYSNATLASKNRKFRPSQALHYWNCPPNIGLPEMQNLFRSAGAPIPTSEADALTALLFCNHAEATNLEDGLPFILKFSFASSTIRDFNQPTLKNETANQIMTTVGGV